MKATNKLRFVQRTEKHTPVGGVEQDKEVTMLQQWWEDTGWSHVSKFINGQFQPNGEWRDVPLEHEQ